MRVAAIWRYPAKSMAGERVDASTLTIAGLEGDRIVQVYDRQNHVATARRFPKLLLLHATLGADGEPLVDGIPGRVRPFDCRTRTSGSPTCGPDA